jgi:hypothetical protein
LAKKKLFIAALAALCVWFASVTNVLAEDSIQVFVDGGLVAFNDVSPQIINDRVMVPVRALAEALGARVVWNGEEKKVTLLRGSRYSILAIGNPKLAYGAISTSEGVMKIETSLSIALDSPPVIINDRSLFPSRAIAEAFDAQVEWDELTQSVRISTQAERTETPPVAERPAEAVEEPETNPAFEESDYFVEESARQLQRMHDDKDKFVIVIYDSEREDGAEKLALVKEAAAEAKYVIYGFNKSSSRFTGSENLKWTWDHVSQSSTAYPIVILSYEGKADEVLSKNASKSDILEKFKNIAKNSYTLPDDVDDDNDNFEFSWRPALISDSVSMYADSKDFIYVVYDTYNLNADRLDDIKELAEKEDVPVFYTDTDLLQDYSGDLYDNDTVWFAYDYTNGDFSNPGVFVVVKGGVYGYFTSASSSLESAFKYFKDTAKS